MSNLLTHAAAFVLGFLSAVALLRYVAARRIVRPRPFRRSRVAIRQSDYTRLCRQIDEACRQLDELDAVRARRAVPRIDWIEQVNGCLPKQDSE